MRILLVIPNLACGGAERVACMLTEAWAQRGNKVVMATTEPDVADFYRLHASVERAVVRPGRLFGNKGPGRVAQAWRLRRLITRFRPDVAIAFLPRTNVLTVTAAVGTGVPVVVSERVDQRSDPLPRLKGLVRRWTYRRARALVVPCAGMAEWASASFQHVGVRVIHNPVMQPLRSRLPDAPTARRIVAMGRLDRQKGFDLLLRAFAKVRACHTDWTLVIVGEGDDRRALESLRDDLGLSASVTLPGRLNDPTGAFVSSDVFVFSSRSEGFGMALAEAMACGLPAVAFDCPSGPREVIRNGVDGILVEPEDVDALADAIVRLIRDEGLRLQLGVAARAIVERFSLEAIMAEWDELIAEVCRGSGARSRVRPSARKGLPARKVFGDLHGLTTRDAAAVITNKFTYAVMGGLRMVPPARRTRHRLHWYRFPFELRGRTLWSRSLGGPFVAGDPSNISSMHRLERNEPSHWIALEPGDVFVDVGANVGSYTIRAARAVGSMGRAIAVEPDRENRRALETNLSLNGLARVEVVASALGSRSGDSGWLATADSGQRRLDAGASTKVRVVTLDDLVRHLRIDRLDWIKIDVEGAEADVLRGARSTLGALRPRLFVETHGARADLLEVIGELGYRVVKELAAPGREPRSWLLAEHVDGAGSEDAGQYEQHPCDSSNSG